MQVFPFFAVSFKGLVRSADPTRSDSSRSQAAEPFAAQLALARLHPQLAPQRGEREGYALSALTTPWFELPTARGFAGYGLARALRMLLDVLAGLAALHDTQTESGEGFVHGELTPALLRVDAQGVTRLVPLAPWHYRAPEALPAAESLGHLAPERLLGDAIDRRADVFSAGVLLWEALAGGRLFEHDSVDGIITRLMGGKVLVPELPPELIWAIPLKSVAMRALSVDPGQRFSDATELTGAIEAVARGRVASHADVAAFFLAPPRPSFPTPSRDTRGALLERDFRASHKSSLSALVTATGPMVLQGSELEVEPAPGQGRARRVAWTATGLISLFIALAVGAFTRHNQSRASAQDVPASAPAAPSHALEATPAPEPASPPVTADSAAAPLVGAPLESEHPPQIDESRATSRHTGHSTTHTPPASRSTVAPKVGKSTAPATPRVRDKEAEQYGI